MNYINQRSDQQEYQEYSMYTVSICSALINRSIDFIWNRFIF